MDRLTGKVAIVTGGAGGIGSATVQRLVSEGARVAVADIAPDPAAVADLYQGNAIAIAFDAADNDSIAAMVAQTVVHYGRLDILSNNTAAVGRESVELDLAAVDMSLEFWDRAMAINARSYLVGARYAIPHMIASGGGSIVNTASGSGLAGDIVRTAYGASKAAVMSLTRYIATQYGKQGVRCNAVAPGLVLTETARLNTPGLIEIMRKHILTREFGEPSDIAALIAFLASDESRYITGQTIPIDGGLLAHVPQIVDFR